MEDSGISGRLRAARERLGWSREELAYRGGISWSAVAQAESGRRKNLRPRTLSRLSGALGVSIDYLVNGGETTAMLSHRALIYRDDEEFAKEAGTFLMEGIERSEPALAMIDKPKLKLLKRHLGPDAERVEFVGSDRAYTEPSAPLELFTAFMTDRLGEGASWVRILGEPPWAGRSLGEIRRWVRYESLLNLIFANAPLSLLCPYDAGGLNASTLRGAHETHPHLIEEGRTVESSDYRRPGPFSLES